MRRQLKLFLPIFLVALLVQIFAPIGACWAASLAASDPLARAVICHGNMEPGTGQGDQTGHAAYEGCCSVCNVLQTGGPVDTPEIAAVAIERQAVEVAWLDFAPDLAGATAYSHARARGPPIAS